MLCRRYDDCLAADEIIMDENTVLGLLTQTGQISAVSILRAIAQKDIDKVEDQTLFLPTLKAMDSAVHYLTFEERWMDKS